MLYCNPVRDVKLSHRQQCPGAAVGPNTEPMHRGWAWGGRDLKAAPSVPLFCRMSLSRWPELNATIYSVQYKPSNNIASIVINKSYTSALDGISLRVSPVFPLSEKIKVMCLFRVLGIYIKLPLDHDNLHERCEISGWHKKDGKRVCAWTFPAKWMNQNDPIGKKVIPNKSPPGPEIEKPQQGPVCNSRYFLVSPYLTSNIMVAVWDASKMVPSEACPLVSMPLCNPLPCSGVRIQWLPSNL